MSQWVTPIPPQTNVDPEILEEAALASAQATIQNALDEAGISRADLARAMGRQRSFVTRMLSGTHNLTVRTMARALAACGFEPEFEYKPISWGLMVEPPPSENMRCETGPAVAGTPVPANVYC